jgi:hypothetical protein
MALASCHDGDSDHDRQPDKPRAANPTVEGPVSGGGADDCCIIEVLGLTVDLRDQGYTPGTPFYAGVSYDLAELGYREDEFFISGTAQSYIATDELGSDGIWSVEPAEGAQYKSRIVVVRPIDEADFNGTVIVEWFNVTGGLDAAPDFLLTHTELTREGYTWVGVSAQIVGIEGGGAFDLPLKSIDPERYGSLNHPGDSYAYDIFSQAAQSVRNPVGPDPLDGLAVERMIAVGQSQSAYHLATYYNAIHPTIDLFDAFIVHGRGGGSSPLSKAPQADIPTPDIVLIRDDLPEPVIQLQTETDVFLLGTPSARQEDSDTIRLWEVAGSSHSDGYTTFKSPEDRGDDPSVADVVARKDASPPFINCDLPVNDGPQHWVAKAAITALNNWLASGETAPSAPRLEVMPNGTEFALDQFGNAKGGIRTPYVDTPVARFSGLGGSGGFGLCRLFGTTDLFDDATLAPWRPGFYCRPMRS